MCKPYVGQSGHAVSEDLNAAASSYVISRFSPFPARYSFPFDTFPSAADFSSSAVNRSADTRQVE